jgi:Protein of unknown function (DUF2380)
MMLRIFRLVPTVPALFTIILYATGQAGAAEPSVAVFDFEYIDTSLEGAMNGVRADEQARLGRLDAQLRTRLKASKNFEVLDDTVIAAQAHASNLQSCGGCDADLAERLGADLAITGTVQKVSNLILNINLYVRDVHSRRLIANMSADIRGNTDESWSRGLEWLVRNRLLTPNFGMHQ